MSDEKPWEDESLKGEYYKEKAKMTKPPISPPKPKVPKISSLGPALDTAAKLEKRNKRVAGAVKGAGFKQ